MEKNNFKNYPEIEKHGQRTLQFEETPLAKEEIVDIKKEEIKEEEKPKLEYEKEDSGWEYHGRFNQIAQDEKKIKNDLERFRKQGGKGWDPYK